MDKCEARPTSEPRPDLLAMALRHELAGLLGLIADQGTVVEGGGGMGAEDIHATIDGIEYHIQIHWPEASTCKGRKRK